MNIYDKHKQEYRRAYYRKNKDLLKERRKIYLQTDKGQKASQLATARHIAKKYGYKLVLID